MTSEERSGVVLKAKIEWYREMLQLEPNSKIFLPFARYLAEFGSSTDDPDMLNEAFDVLRRGLELHPDFMEARLFLIELLNVCGCRSQCGAEVARLASLFLSYPDFWDAWREHAISENESTDFAVALGLMSAMMRDKSISVVQLLEAGLNTLRSKGSSKANDLDTQNVEQKLSQIIAHVEPKNTEPKNVEQKSSQATAHVEAQNAEQKSSKIKAIDITRFEKYDGSLVVAENVEQSVIGVDEKAEAQEPSWTKNSMKIAAEQTANAVLSETKTPEAKTLTSEGAIKIEVDPKLLLADEDEDDEVDQAFIAKHVQNYMDHVQKIETDSQSAREALDAVLADTSIVVEPMKSSPFRTASMAEVLTEQGDLIGAIEIYRELINRGDADSALYQRRLVTLEEQAGLSQAKVAGLFAIDNMVDTSFGLLAKKEMKKKKEARGAIQPTSNVEEKSSQKIDTQESKKEAVDITVNKSDTTNATNAISVGASTPKPRTVIRRKQTGGFGSGTKVVMQGTKNENVASKPTQGQEPVRVIATTVNKNADTKQEVAATEVTPQSDTTITLTHDPVDATSSKAKNKDSVTDILNKLAARLDEKAV